MLSTNKIKISGTIVSAFLVFFSLSLCYYVLAYTLGFDPAVFNNKEVQAVEGVSDFAGNSFYASPTGTSSGDGSMSRPWDLQTALNHPSSVKAGDAIFLLSGTYGSGGSTKYISRLTGSSGKYITVTSYEGTKAKINGGIETYGDWVIFRDLEIFNNNALRVTTQEGSHPSDIIFPDGINVFTPHIKIIHNIVHDVSQGISVWIQATNAEVYGNLTYNNGWVGPARNHGHAIYFQSDTGSKLFENNMIMPALDEYGFHGYGESETARNNNVTAQGNTHYSRKARFKTGYPSQNIIIKNNYFWDSDLITGNTQSSGNGLVIENNYFGSKSADYASIEVVDAPTGSIRYNTICNNASYLVTYSFPTTSSLNMNNNTYCNYGSRASGNIFLITYPDNSSYTFAGWKSASKFDSSSTYQTTKFTTNKIFVTPANRYESKRGNITIYNWEGKSSVSVDISALGLSNGDTYSIHNAQNYFGDTPLTGTYDGSSISIPMTATRWTRAMPIGYNNYSGSVSFPDFGAFILKTTSNGGGTTPTPTIRCGDNSCNGTETCSTCAADCGACVVTPYCGDSSCNNGETCTTCSGDCGTCVITPRCGDSTCNGTETCTSCPGDCGVCPVTEEPSPTPNPIVTPPENPVGNLINNFSFESGTGGWQHYNNGQGSFTADSSAYQGSKSGKVSITTVGSNMQLYQTGFTLKPGRKYKVEFYAKSGTGSDVLVSVLKNSSPYTNFGLEKTSDLSTSWKKFSYDFDVSGITSNTTDTRLRFYFVSKASNGDAYYFDNVSIVDIGAGSGAGDTTPDPTPTIRCGDNSCNGTETCSTCAADCGACSGSPTPTLPTSVLKNGDFEKDKQNWELNTSGSAKFEVLTNSYNSSKAANLNISNPGNKLQLYQKDIVLVSGKKYKLEFYAKSNTGHDMAVFVHKHNFPYTDFGLSNNVIKVTDAWQKFSIEFTAKGFSGTTTDARLRFWFTSFAKSGDVYYIDDASLVQK